MATTASRAVMPSPFSSGMRVERAACSVAVSMRTLVLPREGSDREDWKETSAASPCPTSKKVTTNGASGGRAAGGGVSGAQPAP